MYASKCKRMCVTNRTRTTAGVDILGLSHNSVAQTLEWPGTRKNGRARKEFYNRLKTRQKIRP